MNKIAKTNLLIGMSIVIAVMGVFQLTAVRVARPQFNNEAVLQQDELQSASESANHASTQVFLEGTWSSLHTQGFDDYQIKTLDISINGTDAIHTSIWAVARDLPNGDRELIMGKIYTDMARQQDGSWKPTASTWTEGPFSRHTRLLIADAQGLDNEIERNAQTALNQTRQMIIAELTEKVEML